MNDFERLLLPFLPPDALAPEFDPDLYRLMHADLAAFDTEAAAHHFDACGRAEGRVASPAVRRIGFVAQIPKDGTVLEIGPAVRPVLTSPNVRYFDIADSAGLMRRAIAEGYPADRCPFIHYVSPTGDLADVPGGFAAIFSSHCIEHQPDLIQHLRDVQLRLRSGGRYFLIIPDKRYCFDALLPASTPAEILQAHHERRNVHPWRSVYDHYVCTTHNDPVRHWRGDHTDPRAHQRSEREIQARAVFEAAAGGYVDVHAWQFTPQSFRDVIDALPHDLLALRLERLYHTIVDANEFFAVLTKPAD